MKANLIRSVQSYPERLGNVIPIPFWLTILIFWLAIFLVDFRLSRGEQEYSHYTELGITLFYATVGITLGFTCRILNSLFKDIRLFIDVREEEVGDWYFKKLSFAYSGWISLVVGFVFALAIELTAGDQVNAYSSSDATLQYFRTAYRFLGFFLLGMSLWALVNVLFLPSGLGKFQFKPGLSTLSGYGLFSLGNAFLRMSLMTICCFFVLVCTVMVSPLAGSSVIFIWVLLGSILIFCFFLLPLISIHRIMAKEKREQLILFSSHLDTAFTSSRENPTAENLVKVKEMFELHQHLKSLNDWPFNMTALWQLISVLLIPLLLVVLQIIFESR